MISKKVIGSLAIGLLAFLEQRIELVLADELAAARAAEADAFVEFDQMRRSIAMDAKVLRPPSRRADRRRVEPLPLVPAT